jgi:ATP-dependent RNA helicase DDX42
MKRRSLLDDSDEDVPPTKKYIPSTTTVPLDNEEEDDDPLDAFMAQNSIALLSSAPTRLPEAIIEQEDPMEGYVPPVPVTRMDDSDEEVYQTASLLDAAPVQQMGQSQQLEVDVDHSAMDYYPIPPSNYSTHPDLLKLSPQEVQTLRSEKSLQVSASNTTTTIDPPITAFAHLRLDARLLSVIQRLGLSTPTPIQCQSLPLGLSGKDLIGLAETGSGKTLAYLIPLVVHTQRVLQCTLTKDAYGRAPVGKI